MEEWEYFVRGVVRSIEDFYKKMIEIGRDEDYEEEDDDDEIGMKYSKPIDEKYFQTRKTEKKRTVPRRDLGDLEDKIFETLRKFPDGATLKEIAKSMDMQWHYLRIPMRQLVLDGKVTKDDKIYLLIHKDKNSTIIERDGVKRRIVNADVLESVQDVKKAKVMGKPMDPREKEILRFKVLTAFRGRPEGLTIKELAAVLGRDAEGLQAIIYELINENKVIEGKGGKYHLT